MLSSILEGYAGFNAPLNMMQEQQQRRLANEGAGYNNLIRKAQAQYAPQMEAANLQKTLADIEKMRRESQYGGNLTGELGNVAKVYALEQQLGSENPLVQALKKQVERQHYAQDLRNQQIQSINSTRGFNQLPAAEKSLLLGKMRAAGISDQDVERVKNGEIGFADLLTDQGWTPEQIQEIVPQQAPTASTQSTVQQVQGALAEDAYIGPKITEALGPYSEKIFGYSPEQVMQAFENNPSTLDQRAKALAARALVPEVAGYRTRIAGGSEAHKALSELTHNSLNRLKIFDALVTPEEYKLAQKYIHEWQQGMGEARIRGMQGAKQKTSLSEVLEKGQGPKEEKFFKIRFTDKNGKVITKKIPSKDKDAAIEAGGEIIE